VKLAVDNCTTNQSIGVWALLKCMARNALSERHLLITAVMGNVNEFRWLSWTGVANSQSRQTASRNPGMRLRRWENVHTEQTENERINELKNKEQDCMPIFASMLYIDVHCLRQKYSSWTLLSAGSPFMRVRGAGVL